MGRDGFTDFIIELLLRSAQCQFRSDTHRLHRQDYIAFQCVWSVFLYLVGSVPLGTTISAGRWMAVGIRIGAWSKFMWQSLNLD